MRMLLVIDPENSYRNRLIVGGRVVATGNNGLVSAGIIAKGKRSLPQVVLDCPVVLSGCPEVHRYSEIRSNQGDRDSLAKMDLVCDLLKMSPNACDGCRYHPDRSQQP